MLADPTTMLLPFNEEEAWCVRLAFSLCERRKQESPGFNPLRSAQVMLLISLLQSLEAGGPEEDMFLTV